MLAIARRMLWCMLFAWSITAHAEPCEIINDPAGYRYLECDAEKAKAAKDATALACTKAGPPKKPGHAQSVEEFKASMEAEAAQTDEQRAAAAMLKGCHEPGDPQKAAPATSGTLGGPVHVKGYYRKDGTYVQPHTRRR